MQGVAMSEPAKSSLSDHLQIEMRPERIGHRLMLLREALGLKPAEISDMLGIERTYWSRFEGGRRAVNETTSALLVERFGVTLDFLILGRWDRLPVDLAQKMRKVEERLSKNN
jgi:transcriptional regulator with XRE-family HTH domain